MAEPAGRSGGGAKGSEEYRSEQLFKEAMEEKRSEQLFKEAMEKGYVLCRITLCLLIGVAGSGKTHVKHLLLSLLPPELRQSTPLFEPPTRAISLSRAVFARSSPTSSWKIVTVDDLDRMVIGSIKARPSLESLDAALDAVSLQEVSLAGMGFPHQVGSVPESEPSDSAAANTSTTSSSAQSTTTAFQPTDDPELLEDLALSDLESELVDLVSQSSGSQQLFEVDWVYVLDSGGQPQFRQFLPAFVKQASAVLTVIKLNESLDCCPTVEYYDESGQSCGNSYVSNLTNEEILMRNVRVMESRRSGLLNEGDPNVFVIGTHKDLEGTSDQAETRAAKNSRLVNLLRPIFGKKLGFFNLAQEELIFPVNAKEPGPEDHDVAERIRKAITEMSQETQVKLPLPWWVLDQFLRKLSAKKGLKILSVRECEKIARMVGMGPQACHAALVFLSDRNILFYDPKLLPGVVFITTQVVVGILSALVYQALVLQGQKAQCQISGGGDWLDFRDYGLITVKLLSNKVFQGQYRPKVFTPYHLLHLLKGLGLVARLNEEEYMMPCLLPDLPLASADKYCQLDSTSPVSPLLVLYPERLVPCGVFPLALAYLRNEAGWKLTLRKGKPVLFCCNCAKFNLLFGRRGTVTLLDSLKYLEVHIFSVSPTSCHVTCQEIVRDIFRGLVRAAEILGYGELKPEKAFFCPKRGPDCEEGPHPAIIADDEWVCTVNVEIGDQLSKQQRIWLDHSVTSGFSSFRVPLVTGPNIPEDSLLPNIPLSESDLPAIGKYIRGLGKAEVTELGIQLGLSFRWLRNIKFSGRHHYDVVDAWLKRQDSVAEICPPTWQNLVATLREVDQNAIADKVTKEQGYPTGTHSTTKSVPSQDHGASTDTLPDDPLTQAEFRAVGDYLHSLSKSEVTELGIQLGLSYRWLKHRESSGTYYYDVVDAWLKRQDRVAEMCLPTWQNLVATLREVDQNAIADKVTAERDLQQRPASSGHLPLRGAGYSVATDERYTKLSAYFEAVKEGNTEEVNSLLKSKTFGVDDVLPGGYTALLIAAREGHGELAKSLLAHGAAIVGNVPTYTTPLLEAARHGHSELVKVLLEHGATISDKILQEAKLHDHVEFVKMFAIVMVREAVIDASICCDVNALKELESYCDVLGESRSEFFHDKNHYTPLIHACKMTPEVEVSQKKRRQTVKYLLEKGTCALPSNESELYIHPGLQALSLAPLPPSPPTAEEVGLPRHWKVARDPQGKVYYYHTVTRKSQWERPTEQDAEGTITMELATPEHEKSPGVGEGKAALEGMPQTPDGSPPPTPMGNEEKRGSGLTAFHVACETGDLQVLDMLWASVQKQENRGAVSLNITTADGWNMVHYACAGGWVDVLRWLFEKDPTLRSKEVLNAQTPDDYTGNLGTHEVDGFKGRKTGLHMAAFHDSAEIAKLLVDRDCLLNIKDADGNTPLHVAVKRSSYEVSDILRNKFPAVAKLINSEGKTPDQVKPDDVIPVEIVKRGKKAIDIYKEALSSGKTKIPRVTTLLLGESGAGKSSLYRLLTGQCFDSNLLSTRGIDNQVVSSVECRTVGVNQVLEEIPEDQLNCRLLANSVVKHCRTSDSEITIPKELLRKCWEVAEVVSWLQEQSADLQKSHQDSKQQEVPSSGVGSMPAPDKHAEGVDPRVPEKTAIDNESKQRSEAQAPQEAAGIVQSWNVGRPATNLINTAFKRPQEQLQHCAFFNVLDFAGQRPYIHMHHCFIVRRAIYLVVFNLQELLCFMSEGSSEDPFDKIRFWLNSIAVHSRDMEKEHTDASRIFLVGTHRQLPGGEETSNEQLRSIDKRLRKEFVKYGEDICHINNYWLPEDGDAIFSPVENSLDGLENWEKSGAKHLLEELNKVCYDDEYKLEFLDETYPVNWLVFEDKLLSERKTRKFVQWEEIEALAQPLSIVGDTLKTAVKFFHDTGTIVCLRGIEPQVEPGAPSSATPCPGASQTPAADLPSLFLTDEDMKSLENLVLLDPKWLMKVMRELMELRNINTGKIRKNLGKGYKHEDLQCLEDSGIACERLLIKRWKLYYEAEKGVTFREVCLMLQAYGLIFPKSSLLPDQNDNSPGTAPPSTCDFLVPCMLPERQEDTDSKNLLPERMEDTDSENWGNISFEFDFGDFLPKVLYHRLICLILRRSKPQKAREAELTSTYCKFSDVAGYEFSRWKIEIVEHKLRVIIRSVHEKMSSVPPTDLVKVIHGFLRAICSKRNNLSGITYVGGPMIKKCDSELKCSWSGVLPYVTHPEGCEKSNFVKCRDMDCSKVYTYQDIDGLINPKYKQRPTADPNAEGRLLTPLSPSDLTEVCDRLDAVKVQWENIGQHLDLPEEILEDIEDEYKNNQKRLRKMIRAWLKGRGKKPPTWQSLIDALKHHAVGENATADDIRTYVLSKKA